jgi:cytochrome P450
MRTIEDVPVAPGATTLGHAKMFRDNRLQFLKAIGETAPLVRVKMLHRNLLFPNTPELAHEVLVEKARSFEKSPGIRLLLYYIAGRGLFTSEGELWRRQRRLMAPLFQPNAINRYAEQMYDVATRVTSSFTDGQPVDLARETTRIAMGVVGRALFDANTFDDSDEIGEALTTALGWVNHNAASNKIVAHIILLDLLDDLAGRVPGSLQRFHGKLRDAAEEPFLLDQARARYHKDAIARLDRKVQKMIEERRKRPGATDDLLARLLTARDAEDASFKGMSDRQVRDEALTLFIAGHETTATSLAWTFYLLARNPEWRAKVQAEVDALPAGPIDFARAAKLDVTLRVFKEAMRLYPPVEVLARRTIEPITLGDVELPARSILFVSPWIVHRDKQAFPDPERFDPDRFGKPLPRSAWLPFGAGPRVCIGNHFAMLEGPIVLATMMRAARFDIDATRTIEPEAFATLRPKGGVPAIVRRPAVSSDAA